MSIKKKIEARRDRIAIGNSNNQEAGINTISTSCINNQRLNQYLCTTPGMLLLLLILVIVAFTHMVLFYDFFLNYFSLNRDEKMVLTQGSVEIILNLCIPLYMYWKNNALYDHLAHEILNIPQSL